MQIVFTKAELIAMVRNNIENSFGMGMARSMGTEIEVTIEGFDSGGVITSDIRTTATVTHDIDKAVAAARARLGDVGRN